MRDLTLSRFIETFQFLRQFNCLEAIDCMFKKLIDENWENESVETNKLLIVCFCRANSSYRKELKYYESFLEKSIKYLKEKGFDPKKVLSGIVR